jgi:hypothetical protein
VHKLPQYAQSTAPLSAESAEEHFHAASTLADTSGSATFCTSEPESSSQQEYPDFLNTTETQGNHFWFCILFRCLFSDIALWNVHVFLCICSVCLRSRELGSQGTKAPARDAHKGAELFFRSPKVESGKLKFGFSKLVFLARRRLVSVQHCVFDTGWELQGGRGNVEKGPPLPCLCFADTGAS